MHICDIFLGTLPSPISYASSKARIARIQIRLVARRAEILLTAAILQILSVGQSAVPSPVQVVTVLTLASPL